MVLSNPRFLQCVLNTYNDLSTQSSNSEEINSLKEILKTECISIQSATDIFTILEIRKSNIKYIKKHQDKESFKIVNKEHKYMNDYLSKYFLNELYIENNNITGYVSVKDVS